MSPSPFPPPPPLPRRCGVRVCAISGCQCQAPREGSAGSVLFHLARPGECQHLKHARDAQYLRLLISVCRAPARPAGLAQAAAAGVSCWRSPSRTNFRSGWGGGGWGRVARPGGTRRTAVVANGKASMRVLSPPLGAGDQSVAFEAQQ